MTYVQPQRKNLMKTIQLDVVSDINGKSHSTWVEETSKEFNLESKLITENGPGGGNPLYEFKGTKTNLRNMVDKYFVQDNLDQDWRKEEIDMLMGELIN